MIQNVPQERIIMLGVIVNTAAVIAGSIIGLIIRKGIPQKWIDMIMKALGICTMYIGIDSALDGENTLVLIFSMVIGAVIGIALDIDGHFNGLAKRIENRVSGKGKNSGIAEGFVTASLLWCTGALTIVGSLQAGLSGDNELLFAKSCLDFTSSMILAATMGIGVLFASAFLFIFQGAIALSAGFAAPFLSDPVIAEMTCSGGILIVALGLNLVGATELKIMNYIPAIFMPIVILPVYNLIAGVLG